MGYVPWLLYVIFYSDSSFSWFWLPFIAPFYDSLSYQQILGSHHVDIITFYNEVFVPAAKPFLVSLIASGTRPEDKKNPNSMCYSCLFNLNCYFFTYEELMSSLFYLGQISGSPKPSPFPNLPDMSPKKVSSSHNVYVSPLRQTKVFFHYVFHCFISSSFSTIK